MAILEDGMHHDNPPVESPGSRGARFSGRKTLFIEGSPCASSRCIRMFTMPSLQSVFLFLAVVGGALVLLQGLAPLLGMGDHGADGHDVGALHHDAANGATASPLGAFNFRSVRAIAAGVAFTGIGGLLALRRFDEFTSLALALLLGGAIYVFVAFVMRAFARLEADHSVHPLSAVGQQAVVSLPIPSREVGPGKVRLVVAGRHVEWPAVQAESALPGSTIDAGTPVQVVDAADDTTLTVVPISHVS
jgi:hypothetical protein